MLFCGKNIPKSHRHSVVAGHDFFVSQAWRKTREHKLSFERAVGTDHCDVEGGDSAAC